MKKRERISIKFFVENGSPKASIKKLDQVTSTKNVLSILDDCRKNREIVKGKKIIRDDSINFIYDINSSGIDGINKYSIVVKIKKSEIENHYDAMKYLESLCDLTVTLKNVNRARFIAGIFAGAFILTGSSFFIAKHNQNKNDIQYPIIIDVTEEDNYVQSGTDHYYPTDEEKKQAEEEYYERLRQRAESGDKEASKEYENYVIDQLILGQIEQEKVTKTR